MFKVTLTGTSPPLQQSSFAIHSALIVLLTLIVVYDVCCTILKGKYETQFFNKVGKYYSYFVFKSSEI